MKAPRLSLAAIGIAILILAVDLAVARVALFGSDSEYWANFALCLLPIINILMIGLYRLRRSERRTAGALGFMLAGLAGTFVVFALCLIAPKTAWGMFNATTTTVFQGMTQIFGYAVVHNGAMDLIVGIGLEFPFPMTFFCAPPLVAACFGGWLTKRLGMVKPIERAQTA